MTSCVCKWEEIRNTVKDRLIDDSLLHTVRRKKRMKRQTKVLNRHVRNHDNLTYKEFVRLKKQISEKFPNSDDETSNVENDTPSVTCVTKHKRKRGVLESLSESSASTLQSEVRAKQRRKKLNYEDNSKASNSDDSETPLPKKSKQSFTIPIIPGEDTTEKCDFNSIQSSSTALPVNTQKPCRGMQISTIIDKQYESHINSEESDDIEKPKSMGTLSERNSMSANGMRKTKRFSQDHSKLKDKQLYSLCKGAENEDEIPEYSLENSLDSSARISEMGNTCADIESKLNTFKIVTRNAKICDEIDSCGGDNSEVNESNQDEIKSISNDKPDSNEYNDESGRYNIDNEQVEVISESYVSDENDTYQNNFNSTHSKLAATDASFLNPQTNKLVSPLKPKSNCIVVSNTLVSENSGIKISTNSIEKACLNVQTETKLASSQGTNNLRIKSELRNQQHDAHSTDEGNLQDFPKIIQSTEGISELSFQIETLTPREQQQENQIELSRLDGKSNTLPTRSENDVEKIDSSKATTIRRPQTLSDFVTPDNLSLDMTKGGFRLRDLHDDDEIWIMDIPTKINPGNLAYQTLVLGGKTRLKFEDACYKVSSKLNKNEVQLSCMFSTGKRKRRFKIVNLKPKGFIKFRPKITEISDSEMVPSNTTTNVPFPRNLKIRHPLFGSNYENEVHHSKNNDDSS